MKCFNCKEDMVNEITVGRSKSIFMCPKCKLVINTLNMDEEQAKELEEKSPCNKHNWETTDWGGKCKHCGDEWFRDR